MTNELKPCPFCGSEAHIDNGFFPCESIEYAWCSNDQCELHEVTIGFTPDAWNLRAPVERQAPEVKVRVDHYDSIWLQIGVQSFRLAYGPEDEPNCTAREQAEWMAGKLNTALSNITPCVKMDISAAPSAPGSKP